MPAAAAVVLARALCLSVQAGDRLDGKLAVDFGQSDQVVAIPWPIGQTLEADDAREARDEELDAAVVGSSSGS